MSMTDQEMARMIVWLCRELSLDLLRTVKGLPGVFVVCVDSTGENPQTHIPYDGSQRGRSYDELMEGAVEHLRTLDFEDIGATLIATILTGGPDDRDRALGLQVETASSVGFYVIPYKKKFFRWTMEKPDYQPIEDLPLEFVFPHRWQAES